ncbi:MAG: hypothetical protein F4029_02335 [Gammaproteobacteria bacterium]|nr:hypothetical protein [Gemmatimonadales bacterium]MYF28793.1 hypothetical protein [Gammaproteobacteria bacterium]MYK45047.1 hypothetical protein [Gammaproteobacteria bacterium]
MKSFAQTCRIALACLLLAACSESELVEPVSLAEATPADVESTASRMVIQVDVSVAVDSVFEFLVNDIGPAPFTGADMNGDADASIATVVSRTQGRTHTITVTGVSAGSTSWTGYYMNTAFQITDFSVNVTVAGDAPPITSDVAIPVGRRRSHVP